MTSYNVYYSGQAPPGTIIGYLGTTPPDGWMLCDGQSVQRSSFPELATALGVSTSDASFNLPNLQGVFLRGIGAYDSSHNATRVIRSYQEDCIKQHYHKILYTTGNPQGNGSESSYTQSGTTDTNIIFGSFGGDETAPYCYGVNWIIKTDLNPNVPGQPTIISYTVASNTSVSISFYASPVPYLDSSLTNYEYSINNGISWITITPSQASSPISITTATLYSSVRLRGVNGSGAGQATGTSSYLSGLNSPNGLEFKIYSGYFNDKPGWFSDGRTPLANTGGNTQNITDISFGTLGQISTGSGAVRSVQWIGNFLADTTGTWTFSTTSDDASYVWIGNNAYSDYYNGSNPNTTPKNTTVNNGGEHSSTRKTGTATLIAGVYYPLRIQFGNKDGALAMQFGFTRPGGTEATDGTNFFFSPFSNQVFS